MRLISLLSRYLSPTGSVAFWHTRLGLRGAGVQCLEDYPIDFTAKTNFRGPFDATGAPLLDYKGTVGIQSNPCAVAQFGLGCYQRWLDGDRAMLERARAMGEWLLRWADCRPDRSLWLPYKFSLSEFGLKAPFYSGLAQANALSLLLRLHHATSEEFYAEAARALARPMRMPVEQGGLRRETARGPIIEEFVLDRTSAVLDGWLFAVLALHDLALLERTPSAIAEFDEAICSLEAHLPEFDLSYWSRADLYAEDPKMPASFFYHGLHVLQLRILASQAGSERLQQYAERWAGQQRRIDCRARALAAKIYFKCIHY